MNDSVTTIAMPYGYRVTKECLDFLSVLLPSWNSGVLQYLPDWCHRNSGRTLSIKAIPARGHMSPNPTMDVQLRRLQLYYDGGSAHGRGMRLFESQDRAAQSQECRHRKVRHRSWYMNEKRLLTCLSIPCIFLGMTT